MFNELIYLVTRKDAEYDEDGFLRDEVEIKTKVFAEIKTTTYKEYYEASRSGEKATDIFVVDERDYNASMISIGGIKTKPSLIEYDGALYRIIRRYKKGIVGNFVIELTCEEVE